jgi:hypothetical protein
MNVLSGMSGNSRNIVIRFVADTMQASRNIDGLIRKMGQLGGTGRVGAMPRTAGSRGTSDFAQQVMRGTTPVMGDATGAAWEVASAGRSLAKTLGIITIALAAFGYGLKQILHFGNLIEQTKITFEAVTGSAHKAVQMIAGMREFSRKTQFLPEDIIGSSAMLVKYGVDPFKKGKSGRTAMELMGGLASMPGMGGQPIGLSRAINAAIAGRDIRPLKALGPDVLAAYEKARAAGTSGSPAYVKTMMQELEKIPVIMKLFDLQINSVKAKMSTIAGYAEEIWMDISGAGEEKGVLTFWSQFSEILTEIRDSGAELVNYLKPFFVEFGASMGAVFKFMWELLKGIFGIVKTMLSIWLQVYRVILAIGTFLWQTFGKALKFIFELVEKIFNKIGGAGIVNEIVNRLMEIVTYLQSMFQIAGVYVDHFFQNILDWIDKLTLKGFFRDLLNLGTGGLNNTDINKIDKELGLDRKGVSDLRDKKWYSPQDTGEYLGEKVYNFNRKVGEGTVNVINKVLNIGTVNDKLTIQDQLDWSGAQP